ncbi:MAG: filamentous hemagglutinin family protein [Novosphingobium sp.]|uniref:filamentous haemagglutinin family protein n=1 Tax=Novosphingobium sp. TaxID=1874826 RepID=UPI00301AF171
MNKRSNTVTGKRQRLLASASALVLGLGCTVAPAHAQMARLQGAVGAVPVITASGATAPVPHRSVRMQEALAQQQAARDAVKAMRGLVTQAREAALAATRIRPTEGLSLKGLNPAVTKVTASVDDPTGLATWQGALLPTQTEADGKFTVTIKQTDSRALLSWNNFDVGAKTSLVFDQTVGGKAQTDWVVLNRVVDPNARPTTILGSIKAPGTVFVLNRSGVIFGNGAQVNVHSLLASSLEIGNFAKDFSRDTADSNFFTGLTLKERNTAYLENGLLGPSASPSKYAALITSSLAGSGRYATTNPTLAFSAAPEGDVVVDRGASIAASGGGFVILTAPNVSNDGQLSAPEGQVSLQAGRAISFTVSTGDAKGADSDIRGLILRTITEDGGAVVNSGLIDVPRGYISLGSDLTGSVENAGLLSSTTSVSRNGTISLLAGTVRIAGGSDTTHAGGISILDDSSTETVPQGTADEPAAFKTSRIDIGAAYVPLVAGSSTLGLFGPASVEFGANTLLLAPSANVSIGTRASQAFDLNAFLSTGRVVSNGSVTVGEGVRIDVSGIKDVTLEASRNVVTISPLKGNELRDTPNYRDVRTDGSFTLNGRTVTIDPRRSGVRADGVRWVGSPLIEAGSAASQIGVGAAELMTKGGTVTFGVALPDTVQPLATTPQVKIARSASVDFSGGWVHYNPGWVYSSRLIQADGTLVDIADADPNGVYIGLADGFTDIQSKFGIADTFTNRSLAGQRFDPAYDEGRDAGGMVVIASTAAIDGTLHGDAFAGERQLRSGTVGTARSAIALDQRQLQSSVLQLPSGGFFRVGSFSGSDGASFGGDILVHADGATDLPTGQGVFLFSDRQLSEAGLSALTLQTSGGVTFGAGTKLALANGGKLTIDAGRTINFDGTVTARGGAIVARTYELGGTVDQSILAQTGSAFTTADDTKSIYAKGEALPALFDINVRGTLDVAGLWSNDFLAVGTLPTGQAWTSGGSISLTVAPKVVVSEGTDVLTAKSAVDLSGSILLAKDALLNVASGGYVDPTGALRLTARGGSVSLINETTYASLSRTAAVLDDLSTPDLTFGGENQSVAFTPYVVNGKTVRGGLVPLVQRSVVSFEAENFKGFSFGGGGTFTLVAPEIALGGTRPATGSWLGLDFLQKTGFGGLDLTTFRSRAYDDLLAGGPGGTSTFLVTTKFVIGEGETLDLNQALLPNYVDPATSAKLAALQSGSDVTSVVSASVPTEAFDQRAATLTLGGLTELTVAKGGTVTGAAGASITAAKLLNQGTIRIVGGSIQQRAVLPEVLFGNAIGVRDEANGGNGLGDVLGGRIETGGKVQYTENAASKVLFAGTPLTNGELFSKSGADRVVYFLGALDKDTGLRFDAGSVTDLSGGAVFDPRAPLTADGHRVARGQLFGGGTITTASSLNNPAITLFSQPVYGNGRNQVTVSGSSVTYGGLTAGAKISTGNGAQIDLRGATARFDEQDSSGNFALVDQWSNGGAIRVLAGGSLAGATIRAGGGAANAEGGTLEWFAPIVVQAYGADAGANSLLAADQITASGFTTFVARGSVNLAGGVDLKLDKAFILSSANLPTGAITERDLQVRAALVSNGDATIEAPYILLSSQSQTATGDLATSATAGSLTFSGKSIDLVGGLGFAVPDAGSVHFDSSGDVRLIGVKQPEPNPTVLTGVTGAIVSSGDIAFSARQVYTTTGTGNLQRLLEDRRNGTTTSTARPYLIATVAANGTVSFDSVGGALPDSPLSAGSWLRVLGAHIRQDGVLRAPLGLIELGSSTPQIVPGSLTSAVATSSITFGEGSVTSVTGTGLNVPYGQTTDLTEYYFAPNVSAALTTAPTGQLVLSGEDITIDTGAKIDGRGGGDVFAFEFVSGTGGSRDLLSRLNADAFSSNDGLQFADGRQVYAILPVEKAGLVATYDPIYSADYGAGTGDLYGAAAGRTVHLDGAPGIPAGDYLLLPAHYALLPGAMRLVENTSAAAPYVGASNTLLDGSVQVGGTFGTAGTDFRESQRRSFTVQSASTFKKYSKIQVTSGTDNFNKLAEKQGRVAPRSPLDAARFVVNPGQSFTVNGTFDVATTGSGRGAQFDIAANAIAIRSVAGAETPGVLTLTTGTLTNLNANSLLLGGVRQDNADGTTRIDVTANTISVAGGVSLTLPELVMAVAGQDSRISVGSGASLTASGTLADSRAGNYVVGYQADGSSFDNTGIGAVLRLSSGPDRLVTRDIDPALGSAELARASLRISSGASLKGNSIALNASGTVKFASEASITASNISLGSAAISFGSDGIDPDFAAKLASADRLTLQSRRVITLGSSLPERFNTLAIDAPGLASDGGDVTIRAKAVEFGNSGADRVSCATAGLGACGADAALTVKADEITFGNGTFRLYGFDGGVALDAAKGIYVAGKGAFAIDDGAGSSPVRLTMKTPVLADRSATATADIKSGGADYTFLTRGRVIIDGTGRTAPASLPAVSAGSIIAFGSSEAAVAALTINNATVRATSGIVQAYARGNIVVTGNSVIAAPGFTTRIGATEDALVATAGGGTITLQSNLGDVTLAKTVGLVVDSGVGNAGHLNLVAAHGTIDLGAALNSGIASGTSRGASLLLDGNAITDGAGGTFDFSRFVTDNGAKFQGTLQIHTGTGDLALASGQTVKARSVTLATDSGRVTIAGTIDTSGADVSKLKLTDPAYGDAEVSGGDIALYGADGVTLAGTAKLLARTSGYGAGDSRQARGGNVTLGIASDSANVTVAVGSVIDVSATRPGDRLVRIAVKDPQTLTQSSAYRLAAGDLGGTVTFRAPVIENDSKVDVRSSGTITGAREVAIAAFKRFDLDAIAAAGVLGGVVRDGQGNIHLDAAATGEPNFLADLTAPGALPQFVRDFSVTLKNGGSLAGIRVRPEMELSAARGVILDSNINLGAGHITDYAGALADGYIAPSELGPDAAGNPRYRVVAGKEAALFAKYVDMTYRVGGKVTGEAGVFTLRAGGSVQVANSISDGFFAFHDRTDPDYINHQLGGGDRSFHPAVQLDCAAGGLCDDNLASYSARIGKRPPSDDQLVVIDLTLPVQGAQSTAIFVNSPYSASANSVAANGTGNGIGVGELFPLVDGKPVASSDIRLVAGALAGSADPTQIDRASKGDVVIAGEKSYSVVAREGNYTIGGGVQLGFLDDSTGNYLYGNASGDFFTRTFADFVDPTTAKDFYTKLVWGSDSQLSDEALAAAQTFFAGNRFIKEDGVVTGVYASLGQVAQFLAGDYGDKYRTVVAPDISIETGVPVSYPGTKVYYRPLVRTGSGDIRIAAARDIDLVGTSKVTYRDVNSLSRDEAGDPLEPSFDNAQIGGSAVYTAGTRLAQLGSVALDAARFDKGTEKLDYIPSTQGTFDFGSALTGNGGSVSLVAGRDVVGRRDVWSEAFLGTGLDITTTLPGYEAATSTFDSTRVGSANQRWRLGQVGLDSAIAIVPQLFTSGVGALSGGNVAISAGRDLSDLTIALDNSVVTQTDGQGQRVLVTSAAGDLALSVGRDLLGGQIDLAQGTGRVDVGRSVSAAGETLTQGSYDERADVPDQRNLLRIRVSDAAVSLTARGTVDIGGVSALGANEAVSTLALTLNSTGFFSPIAAVSASTIGSLDLVINRREQRVGFMPPVSEIGTVSFLFGTVLPPTLQLRSLSGDLSIGNGSAMLMYPSQYGQLSLVAGGDVGRFALAMSDANTSDLPGAFTVTRIESANGGIQRFTGLGYTFGSVIQPTDDPTLRLLHDRNILHAGDSRPVDIFAGGSISDVQLNLAKSARINAGRDIIDFYFEGQNLAVSDITSVVAGRDITATTQLPLLDSPAAGRPFTRLTNFLLGGPGTLSVQAGRDLGPFLNSATVGGISYAGGIRTIGNEANPWLPSQGADIFALFGVVGGADYTALRTTYLDPANLAKLDGDLFVQNVDSAGNKTPDRSRPVYAPKLALWLQANAPDVFASVFADRPGISGDALTAAAYSRFDKLYAAFIGRVPEPQQRQFLIKEVYFGEIAAPADPNGPSYQQYVRGYRAIQTLFPTTLGYTDNLATFETDPASVTADHPLGEAVKKLVDGEPALATRIITGNVDLRLATIQTSRGGTIDILGPGGDLIAGSVVRTSEQAARKSSMFGPVGVEYLRTGLGLQSFPLGIDAIPIGYEGVLSLRGGTIQSFTDGDFRLNQSRLFTLSGGDITMWSSNGDLNAGQGPKSASNFPPIVLRFTPNGVGEVDSAGSVSGAGIAALRPSLDVAPSRVTLIAPVGTVDAGDAGVRASGDVFVAAARVANADNFKVGGVSVGVPTTAVVAAPAAPASAAAATAATAAQAGAQQRNDSADRRSIIRVDVLGFFGGGGGDNCPSGRFDSEGRCIN